jgi:3-oxoacyl-[acyl-carrier protein] reductase
MTFKDRVAVVTGGAQGIGFAIAETLAGEGAAVAVSDVNASGAEAACEKLRASRRTALAAPGNVAEKESVAGMVDRVLQEWGRIDILVNNAGVTRDSLLLRMKEEDWDLVLRVNLKGAFHCTQAVLPGMMKRRYGRIVSIASIVGVMGNAGQANYAASKAAVIGLTKTVAREYAGRGITANAVAPGFIDTAMTQVLSEEVKQGLARQIPMGRLGTAQDVADAVRFLSSDQAAYITGQVLHVNGGMLMV